MFQMLLCGQIGSSKERVKHPPPPFTTSTLQQEASRKLGFPVRKTMMVAQSLYEGVEMGKSGYQGLITYMRTDSTRVAPDAAVQAKEYIKKTFGDQYAGNNRRNHQQSREQGAHEAIRPTGILWTPNTIKQHLKPDQYKLYKLIWERFIASNMAPALYHTVTCEISANKHIFRATGSRLKFAGFTVVYEESQDSPADDEKDIIPLVEGEKLQLLKLEPLQHFTEPLPRFTEAMLVKVLEENGIGRPSTYAPIISTLAQRDYVRREKRRLYPTELGRLVDSLCVKISRQ